MLGVWLRSVDMWYEVLEKRYVVLYTLGVCNRVRPELQPASLSRKPPAHPIPAGKPFQIATKVQFQFTHPGGFAGNTCPLRVRYEGII